MPKLPNQKLKLLYLSRIFQEKTDETHGLTLLEIAAALREYDICAERKTLYDDIEALKLFGLDIRTVRDSHVRYYLAAHSFELAELRILIDAVQSSRFLTPKKSNELVRKIEELGSKHQGSQMHRQVDLSNWLKTENEEIFQNIAVLHSAIVENRKISCKYFEWNSYKQRLLRKGGESYLLSPWGLIWDDEYYYLIAYDSDAKKIKHFRVDKILKIRLLDEKREGGEAFTDFSAATYSQRVFGMYGGELTNVRFLANNSLAGVVFDRFGLNVTVLNHGECFEFVTKVMVSPTFYSWVLGFGDQMKILSPQWVADEARDTAQRIVTMYQS